jgi:hypothetical protein
MLEEALVILACATGKGCSPTSNHYYQTHPEVKSYVERQERNAKEFVGPTTLNIVAPFALAAAGGNGHIRFNKDFGLQTTRKSATLVFSKEF